MALLSAVGDDLTVPGASVLDSRTKNGSHGTGKAGPGPVFLAALLRNGRACEPGVKRSRRQSDECLQSVCRRPVEQKRSLVCQGPGPGGGSWLGEGVRWGSAPLSEATGCSVRQSKGSVTATAQTARASHAAAPACTWRITSWAHSGSLVQHFFCMG